MLRKHQTAAVTWNQAPLDSLKIIFKSLNEQLLGSALFSDGFAGSHTREAL
jgi:hypothetical protein